jgi:hypothetical protein
MVDAFRHFYPGARDRFTCWHQFTNRRYCNEGIRIDYTLVDRSLLQHVMRGPVQGLRCCDFPPPAERSAVDPRRAWQQDEDYHLTEEAALAAATANGRFEPVSFEGGGIQEASREALDSQFGAPHTGMIYTPPSFSDHIAISLLLDGGLLRTDLVLDAKDSSTKKSQPHKLQTSIASFFGNARATPAGCGSDQAPTSATGAAGNVPPRGPALFAKSSDRDNAANRRIVAKSASSGNKKVPVKAKQPGNSILNHFKRSSGK